MLALVRPAEGQRAPGRTAQAEATTHRSAFHVRGRVEGRYPNGFDPEADPLRHRVSGRFQSAFLVLAGRGRVPHAAGLRERFQSPPRPRFGRRREMAMRSALGASPRQRSGPTDADRESGTRCRWRDARPRLRHAVATTSVSRPAGHHDSTPRRGARRPRGVGLHRVDGRRHRALSFGLVYRRCKRSAQSLSERRSPRRVRGSAGGAAAWARRGDRRSGKSPWRASCSRAPEDC